MIAALINHLWQSTLFAVPAGLLTLALRRNNAGVRYGLWFAASVKFLVPFALLAAAGRLIVDRLHLSLAPPRGIETIAAVVQPFAPQPAPNLPSPLPAAPQATLTTIPHAALPAPHAVAHLAAVPFDITPILLGVWAFGLGLVLLVWALRWSHIRAALRVATPSSLPAPVPVLSTPVPMEPGVVGIVRPVLIVPDGIADRLSPAEWKAILAHELCHIRRRDNLTGAIHMLVEALFWFHPLVWWLGARLVAERERACDEAVVRGGADARTYAEGILKVCRLYIRQPLACAAGVSGSDLKARVEAILNSIPKLPLSPFKKALLLAAGAGAIATPVMAGLIASPEARQAVAHAAAVTSTALGVTLRAPDSDAAKPTVLSRAEAVLSPVLSVAALDVPTTPLARDITPPTVEAPPPAAAPAPIQLAAAAAPAPRASASTSVPSLRMAPEDAKQKAAEFVKSYADATPFHVIGHWGGGLCVHVTGLSSEQDEAVRARVAEVANSVGRIVWNTECQHYNVQIAFTEDAQGVLDSVKTHKPNPLGDRTSDTVDVKTVTLPIQAWYVTNGITFVENDRNDANGLKVNVLYQNSIAGFPNIDSPGVRTPEGGAGPRAFTNVLVIVDRRKTGKANLTALTDYAAMLVLSEPRALGQCNVLPSITDLFASCPDRPAPDGLTAADTAYLTALYTAKGVTIGSSHEAHVVERMADVLADPQAVDPNLTKAREAAIEASARCGPFVFRLGTDHSHVQPRCDRGGR